MEREVERVEQTLAEGLKVAQNVNDRAQQAFVKHTNRRIWLAVSVLPIRIVIGMLLLYIRSLPLPPQSAGDVSAD